MRSRFRAFPGALTALALVLGSNDAWAIDLTNVGDDPLRLDVTETAIVSQRFAAREGENPLDQGYGSVINRLNVQLKYTNWTLGLRLDGSFYWSRPENREYADNAELRRAISDGASRYRDSIYPAKVWLTYKTPIVEATVGDAYVQFGRGLTLSMRKLDELGVDTTVRGAKFTIQQDPFAATVVAGFANPTRVDDGTGRALFLPKPQIDDPLQPQPVYGSDRIVGAEILAGRGSPLVLGVRAVRFTRCAPYKYRDDGSVDPGTLDTPFGSCAGVDTDAWLRSLPGGLSPTLRSSEMTMVGQSLEFPDLWGHGTLYVEGVVQRREGESERSSNTEGNAVYGALTLSFGAVTNTLEVKSYRNFYPVAAGVNSSRAVAFSALSYSVVPTAEPITQDSMFGFFNSCVNGGRDRLDFRISQPLLLYTTFGFYQTKNEVAGGGCDKYGKSLSLVEDETTNNVFDGSVGTEFRFDDNRSWIFASGGARDDHTVAGALFYQEGHVEYDVTKYIDGPFSVEVAGTHRLRRQEGENLRDAGEAPWRQGENYTSLKIAPKWVFSQGVEYTTLLGQPTYYFNGSVFYRLTSDSNLRIFGGQQRGGLKCVSGICRVFPPFEGVRAELTVRF